MQLLHHELLGSGNASELDVSGHIGRRRADLKVSEDVAVAVGCPVEIHFDRRRQVAVLHGEHSSRPNQPNLQRDAVLTRKASVTLDAWLRRLSQALPRALSRHRATR